MPEYRCANRVAGDQPVRIRRAAQRAEADAGVADEVVEDLDLGIASPARDHGTAEPLDLQTPAKVTQVRPSEVAHLSRSSACRPHSSRTRRRSREVPRPSDPAVRQPDCGRHPRTEHMASPRAAQRRSRRPCRAIFHALALRSGSPVVSAGGDVVGPEAARGAGSGRGGRARPVRSRRRGHQHRAVTDRRALIQLARSHTIGPGADRAFRCAGHNTLCSHPTVRLGAVVATARSPRPGRQLSNLGVCPGEDDVYPLLG